MHSDPYHHVAEEGWEYSDALIKLDVRLDKSDCADRIVEDFMKLVSRHSLRGLTASESKFYAKCGLELAGRLAECSKRQSEQSERLVNYVNETLTSPASDSVPETIALVMADERDRSPTAEPTTTNKAKSGVCLDWSGNCQPDAASSATGEITPS